MRTESLEWREMSKAKQSKAKQSKAKLEFFLFSALENFSVRAVSDDAAGGRWEMYLFVLCPLCEKLPRAAE